MTAIVPAFLKLQRFFIRNADGVNNSILFAPEPGSAKRPKGVEFLLLAT
jgi:hypothetical protein